MLHIVLIRPGSTELDDQKRIKGNLDVPLSSSGSSQVAQTADELSDLYIDTIYVAPGQAAQQTASALAEGREAKIKQLDKLANLDHGLWNGKLIEEVKRTQPRVYRQWQEHPETVCPPQGEPLTNAQDRVRRAMRKIMRRHKSGVIALVVPEPMASVVRNELDHNGLGNLWQAECVCGDWQLIDFDSRNGKPAYP